MSPETTVYSAGGLLVTGGVLAAGLGLVAAAPAVAGNALTLTTGEIAVVTALLGAVAGALGLMFRTLQAGQAERIKDLAGQLSLAQTQVTGLQAASSTQTEKVVDLLQGVVAANREANVKLVASIEELTDSFREKRALDQAAHAADADQHREIVVLLHAMAQTQGVRLGDQRDPHTREVAREAQRMVTEGQQGTARPPA